MKFGLRGSRVEELEAVAASPEKLDSRILRGTAWMGVGHGGKNLALLLSMLVLLRLLEPKAFGLVALAWTVTIVTDHLQNAGTTAALIYRRERVKEAAATALVFSWASALSFYAVVAVAAPLVADAFHAPALTNILRVYALVIILRGVGLVPLALLERNIDFRTRSKCDVAGALTQACLAVGLAFAGFGVWSLVLGQLAGAVTQSAVAWFVVPWRPDPRKARLGVVRDLVSYGWYISATNIVNLANNTVDNVVVGRLAGPVTLGFYAVGYRLADFPNSVLAQIVGGGRVMFPVYSVLRGDVERFRRAYLQTLQRIALVALPASVGLLVAAEPIVAALLGPKWHPTVTPLRILAAYGLVKGFAAPSGEVFKGAGHPRFGLAVGALQFALTLPLLIVLVPSHGLAGAAIAMLSSMIVASVFRFAVTFRLLHVRPPELFRSLAPSIVCAFLLATVLLMLLPAAHSLDPISGLAVLVAAGVLVYAGSTLTIARSVVGPIWGSLRGVGA